MQIVDEDYTVSVFSSLKILLDDRWPTYCGISVSAALILASSTNPFITLSLSILVLLIAAIAEVCYRLYTNSEKYKLKKAFKEFSRGGVYQDQENTDSSI